MVLESVIIETGLVRRFGRGLVSVNSWLEYCANLPNSIHSLPMFAFGLVSPCLVLKPPLSLCDSTSWTPDGLVSSRSNQAADNTSCIFSWHDILRCLLESSTKSLYVYQWMSTLGCWVSKNGSQFYWWNPNVYHVSWSCCILIARCCNKNTSFLWGFITHRSSDCHFPGLERLSLRGLFGARSCHLRRNHPGSFPNGGWSNGKMRD